jgi:hypothetical protein
MKLCIAGSFPVIWLFCVQRHTFYRTKVCIVSRFGTVGWYRWDMFPCSDTPFSALYRVSRAVFLSFVYVSCRDTPFLAQKPVSRAGLGWFVVSLRRVGVFLMQCDTPFSAQKSVSRTKWYVFPRFPSRDTGFFHQKRVSQTENTYPEPKCHRGIWKLTIKGVLRIGTVPWLQKDWQSRNTLNLYIIKSQRITKGCRSLTAKNYTVKERWYMKYL